MTDNLHDPSQAAPGGGADRAAAEQAVSVPAILLIVTGAIGILFSLLGFVQGLTGGGQLPPEMMSDPNMEQLRPFIEGAQKFGVVGNVISLALSGLTIYGALSMKKLQRYGLAVAASIIAMVPCFGPCCCIGLPIGIWSIVVLMKPEVKRAFGNGAATV